jgi:hypothetical protein
MIFIFLREVNQIKYKFTPDYNRYKWMARTSSPSWVRSVLSILEEGASEFHARPMDPLQIQLV